MWARMVLALCAVARVSGLVVPRRAVVGFVAGSVVAAPPARAEDQGFPLTNEGSGKGSILTSRPLEWIRVQRQLEADTALGELADPNQTSSPDSRLAAVLEASEAFAALEADLRRGPAGWRAARAVLVAAPFEKKAFKRVFNAYSDNVYYMANDPDRANLYLLGGTPPTAKQTIQYMQRNDALDNIELLITELDYLLTNGDDDDPSDALEFHARASKAFDAYFNLTQPQDLAAARALRSAARR